MHTIQTITMTREQIIKLISLIIPSLKDVWGLTSLISHGGVTDVDIDLQYMQHATTTDNLVIELLRQEEIHEFVIGQHDFFIADNSNNEQIQLCHEGDIHMKISDALYIEIKHHITGFAKQ